MKVLKQHLVTLIVSLLFLYACDKEGPAGPQGPPGPEGPAGPAGSSDSSGVGIIASEWLEVQFHPDTNVAGLFRATIPDSRLTSNFLLNNEVRVYINLGTEDDPVIAPLPNEVGAFYIRYVVVPDSILLNSNLDASTFGDSRKNLYKYFLISADVAAKAKNADIINYAEVKNALGLKE